MGIQFPRGPNFDCGKFGVLQRSNIDVYEKFKYPPLKYPPLKYPPPKYPLLKSNLFQVERLATKLRHPDQNNQFEPQQSLQGEIPATTR